MRRSKFIYHPLSVLICALLGVVSYVFWMRWRIPAGDLSNHFMYVLPIIIPFVAFLFSCAQRFPKSSWLELGIDALVVVTAIMRMMGDVPLVSGHALFLTYAMARPGPRLTYITAGLVMIQVVYLKVFVWHDLISPTLGVLLGLAAALVVRRLSQETSVSQLATVSSHE